MKSGFSQMATALDQLCIVPMKATPPLHKSRSRLSWNTSTVDDEDDAVFMKENLHASHSDSALVGLDTDFKQLSSRSNSTSTPNGFKAAVPLFGDQFKSGFSDFKIFKEFASICTINIKKSKLILSEISNDYHRMHKNRESNDFMFPMPKLKLLEDFEAESSECDSALGDSIHSELSERSRCDSCRSQTLDTPETPDNHVSNTRLLDHKHLSQQQRIISDKSASEEALKCMLKNFSPQNIENLIGRKMGLEQVDIIAELSNMGIPCLASILSFLPEEDLCRMCQVSQQWNNICNGDSKARARMDAYIIKHKQLGRGKENLNKKMGTRREYTFSIRKPLGAVQHSSSSTPSAVTSTSTPKLHQKFWEEAQKLKNDESLRKCPKCSSASKVHQIQERAWCQNTSCSYDYCVNCLNEFHGARSCTHMSNKRSRSSGAVGSRKSKQRLKRL